MNTTPREFGGCFLLHTHLPWLKATSIEGESGQRWFHEAVCDSYLRLFHIFRRLHEDEYSFRIVLSVSAPLAAMFQDRDLAAGTEKYLRSRIDLCQSEVLRNSFSPRSRALADYYLNHYRSLLGAWQMLEGDISSLITGLVEDGIIELVCTASSHPMLPFLIGYPEHLEYQIRGALDAMERWSGVRPKGFWLPECGWHPMLDEPLRKAGIEWTVLEKPQVVEVPDSVPVVLESGLGIHFRHRGSMGLIWDRQHGYPSHGSYRDFYRDLGMEMDPGYLRPFLAGGQSRGFTGFKHRSIEGGDYDPGRARRQACDHGRHFAMALERWAVEMKTLPLPGAADPEPMIVMPFDTELFGHWWFEGPDFLDSVIRNVGDACHGSSWQWKTPSETRLSIPGRAGGLASLPGLSIPSGSWGEGGDFSYWINSENEEYSRLVAMDREAFWLAVRLRVNSSGGMTPVEEVEFRKWFELGFRCLCLEEASDWLFMISAGHTADFGRDRIRHFSHLLHRVIGSAGRVDPTFEEEIDGELGGFPLLLPTDWMDLIGLPRTGWTVNTGWDRRADGVG